MKNIYLPGFLLVIATLAPLLVTSCSHGPKPEMRAQAAAAEAARNAPAVNVAVAEAIRADLSQVLTLTAEFTPFEEVDVMAKVAGYVRKIHVDVGSRVTEGQALVDLEVPEMRAELVRSQAEMQRRNAEVEGARDDLRLAQSAYHLAHLSYERLANVAKTRPGLVAQQEIDEARGKDLMVEAQVAGAKSNLIARQEQVRVAEAEQDRLKAMYAYTKVTAPFAGVVTKRYANTGSMVQAGTASQAMPVVKLSRNHLLRLILPVPESAVPSVKIGNRVDVRVPTLGRDFVGKVARFSGKVLTETRTMETEVDVPNPELIIIPGMYAAVDLGLARRTGALAVPLPARAEEGDHSVVYAVKGGRIEIRRVRTGIETAELVEILSGLSVGDLVVIGNRSALKEGARVAPKLVQVGLPTLDVVSPKEAR